MKKGNSFGLSSAIFLVFSLVGGALLLALAMNLFISPLFRVAQQPASADRLPTVSQVNKKTPEENLFDCATYVSDMAAVPTKEQPLFSIAKDNPITLDDGVEYLGAVWSPSGDQMIFVIASKDMRSIAEYDGTSSEASTKVVAIGKTKLSLYSLSNASWEEISDDGMRPTWSEDGKNVFYMHGTAVERFNFDSHESIDVGESAPATGLGLIFSNPLPNGNLLAPNDSDGSLEIQSGQHTDLKSIVVNETDHVLPAPTWEQIFVGRGAITSKDVFTPAIASLYGLDGSIVPLLRNCQNSAVKAKWSSNGDKIAYPVHADRPEIRTYDLTTNQSEIILSMERFVHLGDLSWSPDSKYIAFTDLDDNSIWVVSIESKVKQKLVEGGVSPSWSPDGKHILYARSNANEILSWNLLEIAPE